MYSSVQWRRPREDVDLLPTEETAGTLQISVKLDIRILETYLVVPKKLGHIHGPSVFADKLTLN